MMNKKKIKPKKLSAKDEFRAQILALIANIDNNGNESMMYLDQHFKWLLKNVPIEVDEVEKLLGSNPSIEDIIALNETMWGVFNVFLYHHSHMLDDIRSFGSQITGVSIKNTSCSKEMLEHAKKSL